MADQLRIRLSDLLRKAMIDQHTDFLKEGVRVLSQALIEIEVQEHVEAVRHDPGLLAACDVDRRGERNA